MIYEGYFYNIHGERISVRIVTHGDESETVEIGDEDKDSLYFNDDPAEIEQQVNDTFDHLLIYQASVSVLSRNHLPELYGQSCRDTTVHIYKGEECVFAGYVEPQVYSQDYNEALDEVTLNCIDRLSALQYSNYRDIGSEGVTYETVKASAGQRTMKALISEILTGVGMDMDKVWWDSSKAVTGSAVDVFESIAVNELLFLGDEEDDVWTQQEVLEEVMRYLNLHIVQQGEEMYIFDWNTVRKDTSTSITWTSLGDGSTKETTRQTVDIVTNIVADCDTQIEIGDTYNVLKLTDSTTDLEDVVESPLDSDSLLNAYAGKQKVMTEIESLGDGTTAYDAFRNMVLGRDTDYDGATVTDWYMQVKRHPNWKMYMEDPYWPERRKDISEYYADGKNQQDLINRLGGNWNRQGTEGTGDVVTDNTDMAMLLSIGSIKKKGDKSDNSLTSKLDMKEYLVISVNGNGKQGQGKRYPDKATIKSHLPACEYVGSSSGGVYSPTDPLITNYILISGKMKLNPLRPMTDTEANLREYFTEEHSLLDRGYLGQTVEYKDGQMYYTRKYWTAENWKDTPVLDDSATPKWYPFTDNAPQSAEYNGVYPTGYDELSKIPILTCMLIIGNKCVVEKPKGEDLGTGVPGTGQGMPEDFVWMTYKERSECADDDEYYAQCFTIGINPKNGDYLIGTSFDIQNNVDWTKGLEDEGTAIPVTYADKVTGTARFIILGANNSARYENEWGWILKPFRVVYDNDDEEWYDNILPQLSSIMIEEFEVKVVSDKGGMSEDATTGDDIVYQSDTAEQFVNKKDDLEFKFTTGLTLAECEQMGVAASVYMSTPVNTTDDTPLLSIHDNTQDIEAKPEQLYVDQYWQEWHAPKVEMTQNFEDGSYVGLFNHYRHPAIGKTFHVEGITRNLYEGTAEVKMKEVAKTTTL